MQAKLPAERDSLSDSLHPERSDTAGNNAERAPALSFVTDMLMLTKPRIVVMAALATFAGAWLAGADPLGFRTWAWVFGLSLTVASASALNMVMERRSDAMMKRTSWRPLAAGRMRVGAAAIFGAVLAALGLAILAMTAAPYAAILALIALVLYVLVYTPMKFRSVHSLWVGAIPGAMPTLVGWSAQTGGLQLEGLLIFALMYAWQVPHVFAISIYLRSEYEPVGIKVAASEYGERRTIQAGIVSSVVLLAVSLLPWLWTQQSGLLYGILAAGLGVWLLGLNLWGLRAPNLDVWGKRFFFATLIYITLIFTGLMADHAFYHMVR